VFGPDGSESVSVERDTRWTQRASIRDGPCHIGTLRRPNRAGALVIEDERGHQPGRLQIGHGSYIDEAIEVEDRTSEQVRRVALAANVIADYELISLRSRGTGADVGPR
jgi:hypothetical protein